MTDIPARYRKRLAVVYIRQSTERQVRLNEGSRRHQESQVEHAWRHGWRRDDVVVIDCDLGHSGLDVGRRGYSFENGIPTDPNDDDQVYVKKIQGLTVSRENKMRIATLHKGRLSKARSGKAVSAPPAGYLAQIETRDGVPVKTGAWMKDPDPIVREAVDAVFRAFRQGRSLARAVRLLKAWGIKVPSRWKGVDDVSDDE